MMQHLVSVERLRDHLYDAEIVVLDASLSQAVSGNAESEGVVPNSIFFDLDNVFSNRDSDLPHTMVPDVVFTQQAQALGINHGSTIVVYDDKGIYSSPRVWYMFKSVGFDSVFVLDGGLPEWTAAGFETVPQHKKTLSLGNFEARSNARFFGSKAQVEQFVADESASIIDARHPDRFNGLEDEPRKGLRRGHIPNSANLYFGNMLSGNRMKSAEELKTIFSDYLRDELLVFSCGSGVTACINALAAAIAGFKNLSVYDGSWAEWGKVRDE